MFEIGANIQLTHEDKAHLEYAKVTNINLRKFKNRQWEPKIMKNNNHLLLIHSIYMISSNLKITKNYRI